MPLATINGEEFTFVDEISINLPPSVHKPFSLPCPSPPLSIDDKIDHYFHNLKEDHHTLIAETPAATESNTAIDEIPSLSYQQKYLQEDEYICDADWRVYEYNVVDVSSQTYPAQSNDGILLTEAMESNEDNDDGYIEIPQLRSRHNYLFSGEVLKVDRRLQKESRPKTAAPLRRIIHKAIGSSPSHLPQINFLHSKSITTLPGFQSNKMYGSIRMGINNSSSEKNIALAKSEAEERALKMNTQRGPFDVEKEKKNEEDADDKFVSNYCFNNNVNKSKKIQGWKTLESRAIGKARSKAIKAMRESIAIRSKAESKHRNSNSHRPARHNIITNSRPSSNPSSALPRHPICADHFQSIKDWETFRRRFYFLHRDSIHDALWPRRGTRVAAIRFAPIASHVKNNFLSKMHTARRPPSISFHGTMDKNMQSILDKGLLVPGTGGVNVANGSAYGVGIYSSRTAGYSLSYARGVSSMFVCAILDSEASVKAHGNILVASSQDCIIPVFLLDFEYTNASSDQHTASLGKHDTVNWHDWYQIRKEINKKTSIRRKMEGDRRQLKNEQIQKENESIINIHAECQTQKKLIQELERLFD